MSRKTKRTPATEALLLEAFRFGCTRRAACAHAGIGHDTLYRWMQADPDFAHLCLCAENAAEADYTKILFNAAQKGDWRAAETWLKRRRKSDWGDNVSLELDTEIAELMARVAGPGQA